jgi:lipopolysaccharide export system permease protein
MQDAGYRMFYRLPMFILDIYIIKKFFGTLIFAVIAFIVIFMIVDLIENLDKFLDMQVERIIIIKYYFLYVPYIVSLTLPVGMLLSSLFAVGQMTRYNELIAMKSAGISLYRILASLFVVGLLISVSAIFFAEFVVAKTNSIRLDIYREKVKKIPKTISQKRSNIYLQESKNRKVIINYYDGEKNVAYRVHIQDFSGNALVQRIDAPTMVWESGRWTLEKGVKRKFNGDIEEVEKFDKLSLVNFSFKPTDLFDVQKKPEEMNYMELKEFTDRLQAIGGSTKRWIVDLNMKISYHFANFIIVLFGAPLASSKRRSGAALGVAISLIICFIYFGFVRAGQILGYNGIIPPVFSAWMGNFFFLSIGIYILIKAKK